MKIEGYAFIPYQGQVRFRFDTELPWPWSQSDRSYDKVLINLEHYGQRPATCREIIGPDARNNELRVKICDIIETQVRPSLENADPLTLFECEMPSASSLPHEVSCIFCLVSK